MRSLRHIFCLCSCALWAVSLYAESGRKVTIGYLVDLTGSKAEWGTEAQAGARLAVRDLNEPAWPVEIVFADHQSKGTSAVAAAEKMLAISGADALVVEASAQVSATAVLAAPYKRLFIGNSAESSFLAQNPFAFKLFVDYRKGCREIAGYWKRMQYGRVGLLKSESETSALCEQGAREVFPDLVVVSIRSGDPVAPRLKSLRGSSIEALFQVGAESDVRATLLALGQMQWRIPLGVHKDDGLTPAIVKEFREALEGTTAFGLATVSSDFSSKLKAFDPHAGRHPETAAFAYLAVQHLVTALRNCKAQDRSCQLERMNRSASSPLLGFAGYEGRSARLESNIEAWGNGGLSVFRGYN